MDRADRSDGARLGAPGTPPQGSALRGCHTATGDRDKEFRPESIGVTAQVADFFPESSLTPAQVQAGLSHAAALIERHGWFRRVRPKGTGCHCLVTAIAEAGRSDRRLLAAMRAEVVRRIGAGGDYAYDRVPDWNDAPERTEQDVLEMLRGAA